MWICSNSIIKTPEQHHWQRVNAHYDDNHVRGCFHCFTQVFLEKDIFFSKIFMKLLMQNKVKIMGNYWFNIKFIV